MERKRTVMITFSAFFILIFAVVLGFNARTLSNAHTLLENSVRQQLISTSVAAREIIDVDAFLTYVDESMFEDPAFQETLQKLRDLQGKVGAEYIYALKMMDGEAMFIFDTDPAYVFNSYELSPVHEDAFAGKESASIMNVQDDWGSFNTGAVPIIKNGEVVGIISTDIEDTLITRSRTEGLRNTIILAFLLAAMLVAILIVLHTVMSQLQMVQQKLHSMAHFDKLTNLPNRQYLFEQLAMLSKKNPPEPCAVFFIDLDNFKTVNDNAGHDAGDELLRQIATYLDNPSVDSQVFRPSSGELNNKKMTARIGGDEFIILVPRIDNVKDAAAYAKGLLDHFCTREISPFVEEFHVGLSIGVALFPEHSDDYNTILKCADIAMYHAKRAGKNNFCVYHDDLPAEEEEYHFRVKAKRD